MGPMHALIGHHSFGQVIPGTGRRGNLPRPKDSPPALLNHEPPSVRVTAMRALIPAHFD